MIVQTTSPKIEFFHADGSKYYVFSRNDSLGYVSGNNLQSYNYQRNINVFSGSFSITIKEDTRQEISDFIDKIQPLDVVKIYENNEITESGKNFPDFIGLITSVSYSANAAGLQKLITLNGKGIEYLFEYLSISLDTTAMAYVGSYVQQEEQNNELKNTLNSTGVSVASMFNNAYEKFISVGKDASGITNCDIIKMIETFYGNEIVKVDPELKYQFPISSNLFTNSVITLPPYIRNLLPENAYEFYGTVIDGKPKLIIRKCPYSGKDWINIKAYEIEGIQITDYALTKSIDEVYTVFYSYVQGSILAPDFYNKANATKEGYSGVVINNDKLKRYGYKPLCCNFIGFNTTLSEKTSENELAKQMGELNQEIADWYGYLDEMYSATIGIVNTHDVKAKVGDKLKFLGGEFYVTGENHSWQYGKAPKITFNCERGGVYDETGKFSKTIPNITKHLAEWEKKIV